MRGFALILLLTAGALEGATEFSAEDIAYFSEEVRPLLQENCFKCHGGEDKHGKVKVRSGLQLISRKGILIGGDHGPAFDEADPSKSRLLYVLTYVDDDLKMPPKEMLDEETVAVFKEWVKRGLPWTPEDADRLVEVEHDDREITTINEHTKSRWSYRPMVRPEVPTVAEAAWKAPIDSFIYDAVDAKGLTPSGEASRGELIRRAYYNLTGLAPTLAEVQAFEQDASPDAWEKVIDRLLASPGYGEKWARHWLDLVRYGETNGFERDADKLQVWRYRDYVIKAFNEDRPYDQFVREQLAGDEFPVTSLDSMVATGYHRLMQWDDEAADKKQNYYDVLDDNLRTTTEGLLGMTIGCARCHDHKGDPISQVDYYSFLSFFRGIAPMRRGKGLVERVVAEGVEDGYEAAVEAHRVQGERWQEELAVIAAQMREANEGASDQVASPLAVFVADARSPKPSNWHYTVTQPADGWEAVGFRAEKAAWQMGLGGFGTNAPEAKVRTKWDTPELWLQTTFLLEEIPKALSLSLHHDEELELYLNGQLVLSREGFRANYDEFVAAPKFMSALQTGRNVVAAHVRQSAGGQYFDFGVRLESKAAPVKKAKAGELAKRHKRFQDRLRKHQGNPPKRGVDVMAASEVGKKSPPTYVHIRGNANSEDEEREVQPRIPSIFGGELLPVEPPASGRNSSGRRTALADWICRDDNPRTARVMMNRVWQHHFGRGICPTPNDFGFLGEMPTHPELLDWLATEFVAQGWSLKAMHKQIMLSRAFRMSSRATPDGLAKDPDNESFWRFDMRRLTAEEVRDSILAVSGTLNRKMGGPSVFIPLPAAVLATSSTKGASWGKSSPEDEVRRSVYVKVKRSMVPPQFADLDVADTDTSCPVRFVTTVPTQALGFLNSEFMNAQAEVFAKRLRADAGPERRDQVRLALELAMARPVSEGELESSDEFFEAMRTQHGLSEEESLDRFALLVLNLNEFIFLD
jgi:hypothetical protein